MPLLEVENIYAGYGKKEIIREISFHAETGQIVGILGPNGSGKSTLMKALCKGISYRGSILLDRQDIQNMSEKELAKRCSYVPQKSGLSIDISVMETVLMGFHPDLGLLESPSEAMKKRAKEELKGVGLEDFLYANYMELSEGQKRLCILARSMVRDAKLLLMDEPDAALDFSMRNAFLESIYERVKNQQTGVLVTLHDTGLALSYCDRIYLMQQGKFVDEIKPKEDSISETQAKLSKLYGKIRLIEYTRENGKKELVMVQA